MCSPFFTREGDGLDVNLSLVPVAAVSSAVVVEHLDG
jgi:hypothetical protein